MAFTAYWQTVSFLTDNLGESKEYTATDTGEPSSLYMLQSNCTAKQKLVLKVGAQVILLRTLSAEDGLVNGAKGVVVKFSR
jgi:ATP-dependent DNA helicase PIF1